jgi:hypothetical protein
VNVYRQSTPPPLDPPPILPRSRSECGVRSRRSGEDDEPVVVDLANEEGARPSKQSRVVALAYAVIVAGMIVAFVLGFDPHAH